MAIIAKLPVPKIKSSQKKYLPLSSRSLSLDTALTIRRTVKRVSPFFLGGGVHPKAGGWILDFAEDVVISLGCSLKLVSPYMIWQCALGGGRLS